MILHNSQLPQSKPFGIQSSFTATIDFCVWVLEKDGLQIPPFTYHSSGENMLSSIGLDAESWESWVRNITIKQDPRLALKIEEDINSYVERKVQKFIASLRHIENELDQYADQDKVRIEQAIENWKQNESREIANLRVGYEISATYLSQQYQQGLTLIEQLPEPLRELPSTATPPEFWLGNLAIKNKLTELWQQYRKEIACRDPAYKLRDNFDRLREWNKSHSLPNLDSYADDLDYLKFYFVVYPETVEYAVPPISVIKSFKLEIAREPDWEDSLRRGVLALVEKCSS